MHVGAQRSTGPVDRAAAAADSLLPLLIPLLLCLLVVDSLDFLPLFLQIPPCSQYCKICNWLGIRLELRRYFVWVKIPDNCYLSVPDAPKVFVMLMPQGAELKLHVIIIIIFIFLMSLRNKGSLTYFSNG